jgi:RHS repeat-associated protein
VNTNPSKPEGGAGSRAPQGAPSGGNGQGGGDQPPFAVTPPSISLPKGGGAIRGMGEKFAANPVTGSGSMTVPIATSPGRGGFGPQLSLGYDSGAGNGPFGFGWSLSLPSITRKTDKGLPRYLDWSSEPQDADVFLLSGSEDLVPVLQKKQGRYVIQDELIGGYRVRRYRPRIEGLFARIERWQWVPTTLDPRSDTEQRADIHWRSISKDNILTIYGADSNSRIADPADPSRIYSWLICETRDDKGNGIRYLYKAEDGQWTLRPGQPDPLQFAHQRNRGTANDTGRSAQRYLQRVLYGNRRPLLDAQGNRPRRLSDLPAPPTDTAADWLFEVRFDYGELDPTDPTGVAEQSWFYRPDAFSSYRSGFEVRTCRRCERILMLHHIPDQPASGARPAQPGYEGVVRSTDFTYDDELDPTLASKPVYSFLHQVVQTGWNQSNGNTVTRSLPPVEFQYSQPALGEEVDEVDPASLENLPVGLDGATYRWIDLHGEGLPGILTEQAGTWYYKRNLSPISHLLHPDKTADVATLAPLELVASRPNVTMSAGAQVMDLAGDGLPDVVTFNKPLPGLYEHDEAEGWQPFRAFRQLPNIDFSDPNLKFIDLDGDGHADLLISEGDVFVWYRSLEEEGFEAARRVALPWDEEKGPRVVFADGTESIHLADMSGDGLADIVRIRGGFHGNEVCYWPNLGYGRFGAKVTMDHAPVFDRPEIFHPQRLLLADIDGSGTTDLIYLHQDGVRLYFNQAGNGWSEAVPLKVFPPIHNLAKVTTLDLLGNSTACLVWSSPLPGDIRRQMRYVKLMREGKPHLLTTSVNNLGAETKVHYCSSLRFYLEDKLNGKPWITRLPFPVHVVERVETLDRISGNRFVTSYTYHHGYFDGVEREFRGFGMVEQKDMEEFTTFAVSAQPGATNVDAASHVPPVLTKTWFHTGIYLARDHVSDFFAGLLDDKDIGEYYREPGLTDDEAWTRLLPDTVLPESLTIDEEREACRALKGMMLRQEVYALDADDKASPEEKQRAATPYTVIEQNFTLERLQPRFGNRHAVFFAHPREVLSNHYERNPADPRISHALTMEVDPFGNVLKSLAVAYGRRTPSTDPALTAEDKAKQSQLLITYTESSYTQNEIPAAVLAAGHHRAPIPAEARTYELTGFASENNAKRFSFEEWSRNNFALLTSAAEIPYELKADVTKKQKRLIEHVRTLYRKDDLSALLPLGKVESQVLPGETYKLALTPSLLALVFTRKRAGQPDEALIPNPNALLEGKGSDQGGYIAWDGNWWIPSGKVFFDSAVNTSNPALTAAIELNTARQHFFVPRKVSDAFGQTTAVDYDAYDLVVTRTTDPVGNSIAAANDYRVLQPREVTDPNRNRSSSAFDALGMVIATAVMGKTGQPLGDLLEGFSADPTLAKIRAFIADPQAEAASLLGTATTRIVYDLDRYKRAGQPPFAATLARETHFEPARDGQTKIQLSFSFSDGFSRELQKKIQAEPGKARKRQNPVAMHSGDIEPGKLEVGEADAPQRWVGSGRTVFNNKGKPVKQYEPFFSATHLYESESEVTDTGVSPVLFYDPVGRVVATLHPNHTYEKVVFDPWQQTTFDVNDTVVEVLGQQQFATRDQTGDPRTDPDIKGYVREYFKTEPADWKTWHTQGIGNALDTDEQDAARKTEAHVNTPTTAHLDVLGRVFITLAHNKVVCPGHTLDGTVDRFATRVDLDIEGNQRAVRDAVKKGVDAQGNAIVDGLGRIVMRYDYDLLGNRIHQASMEAGERWMLSDAAGRPVRAWDSRLFMRRMTYDELRRPTGLFVTENGAERLAERTVYGEGQGDADNHRGQIYKRYDGAGVVTNVAYDFKGNLLEHKRELLPTYKVAVDWLQNPAATDGTFASSTTFDALNRPLTVISPDGSSYQPTFNEANLLDKVDVRLRGAGAATAFVTNIDYNAKGQREKIEYGNGATTAYEYDPLTFRLSRLRTTRPVNPDATASQLFNVPSLVQDLHYWYDPVGNITRIEDLALKTFVHAGQKVEPVGSYTYDAVYRLIEAKGREHIGQNAFDFDPPNGVYRDYPFVGQAHPNDLQALRNYRESYEYDPVGNFGVIAHRVNGAGWTRRYEYQENSLQEAGKKSNRLRKTTVGNGLNHAEPYTHDAHGNMISMPHLAAMVWDFKDQLQQANLGGGGTAYYVYDGAGQRVRKVIESQNGARQKERLYLGGFEIYREYNGAGISLERESLHVLDEDQRVTLVETQTIQNGNAVNGPVPLQRYQLANHLGSSSVELDKDGALIAYEEYHPYGTTSFQVGRSVAEVSLKQYRYTGKERDEENGVYYHGARYYAPWLGRWLSCDPIGIEDTVNLYQYVRNNPQNSVDVTGNETAKSPLWEVKGGLKISYGSTQLEFRPFVEGSISAPIVDHVGIEAGAQLEFYTAYPKYGLERGAIGGNLSLYAGAGWRTGNMPERIRTNSFDARTFSGSGLSLYNIRVGYGVTSFFGHFIGEERPFQKPGPASPLFSRTGTVYAGTNFDTWSLTGRYSNDNLFLGNGLDANETASGSLQLKVGDYSGEVGFFNVTDQVQHGIESDLDSRYKMLKDPSGVRLVEGPIWDHERKLATYKTDGPGVSLHVVYGAFSAPGFQLRAGVGGKAAHDVTQGAVHRALGYHLFPHDAKSWLYKELNIDLSGAARSE